MTSKQKLLQLAVSGQHGRHWYSEATRSISEFCEEFYDLKGDFQDPEVFTKVLAVLSPQVSVKQNINLTVAHLFFDEEPKVVSSVRTSLRRLEESGYQISAIKGPKTSRFARALLGDSEAVVLDVHMGYALNVETTKLKNKGIQAEAERRVRWVARNLDWSPCETQAAIWTAQRDRAGYTYSGISKSLLIQSYELTEPVTH